VGVVVGRGDLELALQAGGGAPVGHAVFVALVQAIRLLPSDFETVST
jgi:hypothetical protein